MKKTFKKGDVVETPGLQLKLANPAYLGLATVVKTRQGTRAKQYLLRYEMDGAEHWVSQCWLKHAEVC